MGVKKDETLTVISRVPAPQVKNPVRFKCPDGTWPKYCSKDGKHLAWMLVEEGVYQTCDGSKRNETWLVCPEIIESTSRHSKVHYGQRRTSDPTFTFYTYLEYHDAYHPPEEEKESK